MNTKTRAAQLSILLLCLLSLTVLAEAPSITTSSHADEDLLISTFNEVGDHRIDHALGQIETLVQRNPKFRLAQLVYADLLLAKAGPIHDLGNISRASSEQISNLRAEARVRLKHHRFQPPPGTLPEALWQLSEDLPRVLMVDVESARLFLFERREGRLQLTEDYYATIGKNGMRKLREGDRKTPIGVYFVNGRIDGKQLPDRYGAGAFPVNYPNEWDRLQARTGSGIWLHGVPSDTFSRAPRASDGCVAIANEDLKSLWGRTDMSNTPVLISPAIQWQKPTVIEEKTADFVANLERWRKDWQSRDLTAYTGHYSRNFRSGRLDYQSWVEQKAQVNRNKHFIEVGVRKLSIFAYPGESNLLVVNFEQDYRSNNYHGQMRKRQYWRLEADGIWRIIYEGKG